MNLKESGEECIYEGLGRGNPREKYNHIVIPNIKLYPLWENWMHICVKTPLNLGIRNIFECQDAMRLLRTKNNILGAGKNLLIHKERKQFDTYVLPLA